MQALVVGEHGGAEAWSRGETRDKTKRQELGEAAAHRD